MKLISLVALNDDREQWTLWSCVAAVWSRRCWTRSATTQTSAEKCRQNCSATGSITRRSDFQRSNCAASQSSDERKTSKRHEADD